MEPQGGIGGTSPPPLFQKAGPWDSCKPDEKIGRGGGGLCTLSRWSHLNDIFGRQEVSPLEENISNKGKGRGPKGGLSLTHLLTYSVVKNDKKTVKKFISLKKWGASAPRCEVSEFVCKTSQKLKRKKCPVNCYLAKITNKKGLARSF